MASARLLLRSVKPQTLEVIFTRPQQRLQLLSTTTTAPSHHNDHQRNHQFLNPNDYLNSWKPPEDPREAQAKLAQLRRDYAKKVKAIRKEYIQEMELQRLEKQRKDEIRKEALRLEKEERKAARAAAKKAKAAERQAFEEEFRQTLLKERAEKLEYHRMRESKILAKKKEKEELLRRQSSTWIDESELDKKTTQALIDFTPL